MYLKPSQFGALARYLCKVLSGGNLARFHKGAEGAAQVITDVFQQNLEEENRLNDDARKLLDKNKAKVGLQIDEERAMAMIRKQLAKERNFVL